LADNADKTQRYRKNTIHSEALQGNPLGSPTDRPIRIYLPPGYLDNAKSRYPVIYLLHGYGFDGNFPMVESRAGFRRNVPLRLRIPFHRIFASLLTFEKLDRLILSGELSPFILVQPDASLHLPNIFGAKGLHGKVNMKGSQYTDSPFSGNYATYIFEEVVDFVDERYRTIGTKSGRCLAGGSMGGYGALLGGLLHPDRFRAVAALSPGISTLDLLNARLVSPFNKRLYGQAKAEEIGRRELADILDTYDTIFSNDRPLLPTVKRDKEGRAVEMDEIARHNWARSDLGDLLDRHHGAFEQVRLMFNCERTDEFGFPEPCRRFHQQLEKRGIDHSFRIYSDPRAQRISPHVMGIAWRILEAIRFCIGN
jgi:enterochelin esterase-like enzyme